MLHERKQIRKAERTRKETVRKRRLQLRKAAPDLLNACQIARKWFEDYIECKPRPTEQSAIDMQSMLDEEITKAY